MDKSMHSLPYSPINNKPVARRSSAFDFRAGSDVCPTCGGTGKVPKGQQDELVALIPYKDDRLKPRRTCLVIVMFLLIIVVMVITATLLAVFLSPRNVTFTCTAVSITNWTNITRLAAGDEEIAAHMTLQVRGMAKNSNYISITMKNVNVTVNRNLLKVGYSALRQLSVTARQHKEVVIDVKATYKGAEAQKVRFSCQTWKSISLEIMIVSTYKYLSHTSNTEDTSHFYVPCNLNDTTATT